MKYLLILFVLSGCSNRYKGETYVPPQDRSKYICDCDLQMCAYENKVVYITCEE